MMKQRPANATENVMNPNIDKPIRDATERETRII
jgi:hypothetical protein